MREALVHEEGRLHLRSSPPPTTLQLVLRLLGSASQEASVAAAVAFSQLSFSCKNELAAVEVCGCVIVKQQLGIAAAGQRRARRGQT